MPDTFSINLNNFDKNLSVKYSKIKRDDTSHPIASKDIYTLDSSGKPVKFIVDDQVGFFLK